MKSFCSVCGIEINQKVLAFKVVEIANTDGSWWEDYKYQIIQCEGCETISFRKLYNDARQQSYADPEIDAWIQELFPRRSKNDIAPKKFVLAPIIIKSIYNEMVEAFNNNLLILCCAGLRAIIEGICIDKKIAGGNVTNKKGELVFKNNLEVKIDELAKQGFLANSNAQVLHNLRFLGNDALHELLTPSISELKLAINIIEHTIENIYELDYKASILVVEKAKRKA